MDTGACEQPQRVTSIEIDESLTMVTFRAPRDLVRRLDERAGDTKAGRSGLIREACEVLLSGR